MKTMLRNLARLWPSRDRRIATLRQRLREAQQLGVRLKFGNQELARTNVQLTQDLTKAQRERQIAVAQRDVAWDALEAQGERVTELEQALVAQSGKGLDDVWAADAAGVAGPETRES